MAKSNSHQCCRIGLALFAKGRYADAARRFHQAILADREAGVMRPRMRLLSYYGLSQALSGRPSIEAVRLCERAAKEDGFDATLQLNLGKIYLLTGKRTKALSAFERGLRLDPYDARLQAMLARSDRRARPVVGGLGRDHPINRSLGRLRKKLSPQNRSRARG